jgi:hypothetical protein
LGGISKHQLSRYKSILQLCDEAIEIADRYAIDEIKLYYATQLNVDADQVEIMRQIVQLGLSTKQVKEIVEKGCNVATNSDEDEHIFRLPKAAVQIAKLALKPDTQVDAQRLAEAFVNLERDKGVAKARIKALREMLEEAESYIDGA